MKAKVCSEYFMRQPTALTMICHSHHICVFVLSNVSNTTYPKVSAVLRVRPSVCPHTALLTPVLTSVLRTSGLNK